MKMQGASSFEKLVNGLSPYSKMYSAMASLPWAVIRLQVTPAFAVVLDTIEHR